MTKGPIKETGLNRLAIRRLMGIALLLLCVVVAVWAALHFYRQYQASEMEQARAAWQQQVNGWSSQLAAALEPYDKTLDALAKDPAILAALEGSREQRLEAAEKAASAFPSPPIKIRLFPPKSAHANSESSPPLTFASLEMIRAAESSREAVRAEAHLSGSPGEHMVHVRRVEDENGKLRGVIHVSSDVKLLRDAFLGLGSVDGSLELRQHVSGGRSLPLASIGSVQGSVDPVVAGVPRSRWTVSYFAPPPAGLADFTWLWYVLAAIVAAGMLLALVRRSKGGKAAPARSGTADYQGAIKAIMDGAHPSLERLIPGTTGYRQPRPAIVDRGAAPEIQVAEVDPEQVRASLHQGSAVDFELGGAPEDGKAPPPAAQGAVVPASIFRAYDIRGVVGETMTEEGVYEIGRAIGSEAECRDQQTLVVARDGRNSSPAMADALINGLRDTGRDVIDVGMVPTPVLYFATHYLDTGSGVMVTGSHNPANYNGLKIVLGGETLSGEAIAAIRRRIESQDLSSGAGGLQSTDIVAEYIRRVGEEVPVALGDPFTVVVDCGNGVPGMLAPKLIRALGHDVVELYCDVDGNFPNHHPDPSQPENLRDLIDAVKTNDAHFGLAFDGDGDRLGVVDGRGRIIWPDQQLMLFAHDVLSRNAGAPIIYDVKCTRLLKRLIEQLGGKPLMWKTGHSLIKSKMKEVNAPLAGEMSGHIFFKDRWYGFDDALYAAARLLEILANQDKSPSDVFAALPSAASTPELRIDLVEGKHQEVMDRIIARAKEKFAAAEITTIDGVRVDFSSGWGLVRPSNTTPCLVCRFEGDNAEALTKVKEAFRSCLQAAAPDLSLPF